MKVFVNTKGYVLAWLGYFIVLTILIMSLCAAMYVAQHDAHALFATQLIFVSALNAQLADIIARSIILC